MDDFKGLKSIRRPGFPGQAIDFREWGSCLLELLEETIQLGLAAIDPDFDPVRSVPDPALKPNSGCQAVNKRTETYPLNDPSNMDKGARLI
jgi:hypothetical protein